LRKIGKGLINLAIVAGTDEFDFSAERGTRRSHDFGDGVKSGSNRINEQ
jgi:hypothetical protein